MIKHEHGITRREFIALGAGASAAVMAGCATNPVTGRRQFMLLSEADEIALDLQAAPHQLSADYGVTGDARLNEYVRGVGQSMVPHTHRPHMPYSFQVTNAAYFNAYTFPAGTVAATRGIMLGLEDESQLAALIGHELGHVNARHGAERMSKGMAGQVVVALASLAVATSDKYADYAPLTAGLGSVAAGGLLAYYSREDEREADALGMDYAVAAGYSPEGVVGLMNVLRRQEKRQPHAIEQMFASHPMSTERYENARKRAGSHYAQAAGLPKHRERYMDATAGLRQIAGAIEAMNAGQSHMRAGKSQQAYTEYEKALRIAPDDYAALLMMAECCQALNRPDEARQFARRARDVNPREAQAIFVLGMTELNTNRYDLAHQHFQHYQQLLPGNPNVTFWNGFALENMGRRQDAAAEYRQFLQSSGQGQPAQHAYQRLGEWGY